MSEKPTWIRHIENTYFECISIVEREPTISPEARDSICTLLRTNLRTLREISGEQ